MSDIATADIIKGYKNCYSLVHNSVEGNRQWEFDNLKLIYQERINSIYKSEWLNKLLIGYYESRSGRDETIEILDEWFYSSLEDRKLKDSHWKEFYLFTPEALIDYIYILQHAANIPEKHYWGFVSHLYTLTNFAHAEESFVKLILSSDKPNRELLMTQKERNFLAKLPNTITIYRGCSKNEGNSEKYRFSWTLDKKVAEFFAYKYLNPVIDGKHVRPIEDYTVVEKTIDKSQAIAYFNGRKESEIIYIQEK
jgi:hypothetical protein